MEEQGSHPNTADVKPEETQSANENRVSPPDKRNQEETGDVKPEETQSANENRVSPPDDKRNQEETGGKIFKQDGDSAESPDESSTQTLEETVDPSQADKGSHGDYNSVTQIKRLQTMTAGDNKPTKTTTQHTLHDCKEDKVDGSNTEHNEEATGTNNTDDKAGDDKGSCSERQENTTSLQDEEKKDEQKTEIQTIRPTTLETKPGGFNRSDEGSCLERQENTTSPQDEEKKYEQKNEIQTIRPTTLETKRGGFNRSDDGSASNILQTAPISSRRTALPQDNKEENEQNNISPSRGGIGALLILMCIMVVALAVLVPLLSQSESPRPKDDVRQIFLREMEKVKTQFPNQRAEVWDRSKIHLLRHLETAQPTEPVSLILTAGIRAERTLHCLAKGLASAFSFALNASVLHIDGASKASQDSDQVKLDIDSKLQGAFEGDKPVAIIHRFEELPPGSTLIFYRYCDHENAAYKKTFLIFTVLLGEEEEIPAKSQLSAVEEMVDDHLQKKFLSDGQPVSFDRMDLDKYGGLWSRISHLILPVAAEKRMEHEGC